MLRVLLVEDDPNTLTGLAEILSYEGYSVETARNGAEGMAAVSADVDLVVSDLRLPDFSGLKVVAALKKVNPSAGSIIMTAHSTRESYDAGKVLGVSCWLTKPLDLERLLSAVDNAVLQTRQELPSESGGSHHEDSVASGGLSQQTN